MTFPSLDKNPDSEPALRVKESLEHLAAEWLDPYIGEVSGRRRRPGHKVINDAVWGTIRLFPWEVAILDSPLMQRLRRIRQLGVVHWVYHSAVHTRFEHSLGALHQVQALVSGIERSSGDVGDSLIDDVTVKLLRIAGLVHDCGHVIMSHVGEGFIKRLPGVEGLRHWLNEVVETGPVLSPVGMK